jgi:thymidine kinase
MIEHAPHLIPKNTGWIEVISGCMFSGKTEELIRRLKRAQIARQIVKIFKPDIDNRFSSTSIISHSELSLPSIPIHDVNLLHELSEDAQVIGIDEAQFFSNDIIKICNQLADSGKRVIVAGLDQDYRGVPFGPIPGLLAAAEYITKTLAICVICGNPADKTQRKTPSEDIILIGASDIYEARCRRCHYIPKEQQI